MLVKINKISDVEHKVNVTLLDIDDLGSVVPIKDLELNLPSYDESVISILKTSTHVIIFIDDPPNGANPTIISAINLTDDELNHEKENMIKVANDQKKLE
ncbi:hypothetical protein [Candidatus Nitrosocosmicus sp. R]